MTRFKICTKYVINSQKHYLIVQNMHKRILQNYQICTKYNANSSNTILKVQNMHKTILQNYFVWHMFATQFSKYVTLHQASTMQGCLYLDPYSQFLGYDDPTKLNNKDPIIYCEFYRIPILHKKSIVFGCYDPQILYINLH